MSIKDLEVIDGVAQYDLVSALGRAIALLDPSGMIRQSPLLTAVYLAAPA